MNRPRSFRETHVSGLFRHQDVRRPPRDATATTGLRLLGPATRLYRCQAVAHTSDDGRIFPLGTHAAGSPRLALRWLHLRAHHIADQLDPPAARPVLGWLHDDQAHEHALAVLASGTHYTHTIRDDAVRYLLAARPTPRPYP
ncbi:hypothetical protein IQ279_11005 [Streptomyces verrucosisporus]|uniref:hypothetical protein n=1 Tax=Streptomyces verrucosisporus TaxID=1695161 RepID=UPI0019D153F2|nr:hypothetical protein [Streptomyces verrucosisporus]MBN3930155.1 hypothetical protein [Streptomyces verrucosisporus]